MKSNLIRRVLMTMGLALALSSASLAKHPVFTHGVASGEVTPNSTILWTRLDQRANVIAEVSLDPRFRGRLRREHARASADSDFTLKVEVDGLEPASKYFYRFRSGNTLSDTGAFRTPPLSEASASVRFGWASDLDGSAVPPFNNFETLDRAREDDPDFFIYIGDNIYADQSPPCGSGISCMRAKYKRNREYAALRDLLASTGSYAIWDDHEVVDDFAGQTVEPALLAAGRQAFEEYMPIRPHRLDVGFYRTFRWGKDVELFILDERSFRSALADLACQGDLLPAVPPPIRLQVGLPPEPPPGCLAALNDPGRTLLGATQKELLKAALLRSDATWKMVINEVAIAELLGVPYDRWEGYAAERAELLNFLRGQGIKNVVFLTGDFHANIIADVRPGIFTDPASIAKEFIAGPVAQRTLLEELVQILGSEAQANAFIGLVSALTMPACVQPNAYAYGLAEVDGVTKQLRVTIKNGVGIPICSATLNAE